MCRSARGARTWRCSVERGRLAVERGIDRARRAVALPRVPAAQQHKLDLEADAEAHAVALTRRGQRALQRAARAALPAQVLCARARARRA